MKIIEKYFLYIIAGILALLGIVFVFSNQTKAQLGGGSGTIGTLDQWKSTTTPEGITPRTAQKKIEANNSIGNFGVLNTSTTTATSTFTGGVFANDLRTNLPSCDSIDTDSTGAIICGIDADTGGAGSSEPINLELSNNVSLRSTSTGPSGYMGFFVRGAFSATSSQDLFEVAGDATVHDKFTTGYISATSTVSTSTIVYGLDITDGGIDINLPSCANELETDSNGALVCGSQDVTGDWTGTIDGNNFAGGAIGAGELIYGGSAGSFSELAAGTRGTILSMTTGGIPGWVSTSTFAHLKDDNAFSGTGSTTFVGSIDVAGDVHSDTRLTTDGRLIVRGTGSSTIVGNLDVLDRIFATTRIGTDGYLIVNGAGTSTFTGGITANALQITKALTVDGAGTSTFTGGVFADSFRFNQPDCSTELETDSTGAIICGTSSAGSAAGNDGEVQYNNGGSVFGGAANLIYNDTLTYVGIGSSTPWGLLSVEQLAGQESLKPVFVVGDNGTSSPFIFVDQQGGVSIGTSTVETNNDALFSVGTTTKTYIHIGQDGRMGIFGQNNNQSRLSFGDGSNASVNPNVFGLFQDLSDARFGASVDSSGVFMKSSGGVYAYDYIPGASKPLNLQEFGGVNGTVGIASSTPGKLLGVEGNALIAGELTMSFITGTSSATSTLEGGLDLVSGLSSIWAKITDVLRIPFGGAPAGSVGGDIGVDNTNEIYDQFVFAGDIADNTLSSLNTKAFDIASSTAQGNWNSATTTHGEIALPYPVTVRELICKVDGGTSANVELSDGTNILTSSIGGWHGMEATTTIGKIVYNANNTFTEQEPITIKLGSTSGTPNHARCTIVYFITRQ